MGSTAYEYGILWGGDENFRKLIVMMVIQLCEYTKNYLIVYFKWVNCMIYELWSCLKMKAKWRHFGVKVLKVFEGDIFKENPALNYDIFKNHISEFFWQHEKEGEMVLNIIAYILVFFPGMKDLLLVQQCQHFLSLVGIYSSKLAPSHQIPRFTFVR